MVVIAVVLVVAAISVWIEVLPMWKQKEKKDVYILVSSLLFAVAIVLIKELHLFDFRPMVWMNSLFQPVNKMMGYMFQ